VETSRWEIALRPSSLTYSYEALVTVSIPVADYPTVEQAIKKALAAVPHYVVQSTRLVLVPERHA
jgi:hypothetical protein